MALGDVCSDYLADTTSAGEIAASFPHAKIIIVLRNPADRAFSLYQWMVREGYEYLPTFELALAAEAGRTSRKLKGPDLVSPSKQAYLYFSSGLYSEQIRRFFRYFSRGQVLVMKYDELSREPIRFMRQIYSFIGVNPDFLPTVEIHNRGKWPFFPRFQYFCRRRLARVIPNRLLRPLMRMNMISERVIRQCPDTRRRLLERYEEDIKETEALTGLDLGSWRT